MDPPGKAFVNVPWEGCHRMRALARVAALRPAELELVRPQVVGMGAETRVRALVSVLALPPGRVRRLWLLQTEAPRNAVL